jgi:CDP-glucose 4,6-dehydratase
MGLAMDLTPNFWNGKRVFLTGHTGFKGSWLSLWLQALGADLAGFALDPPTVPAMFDEAEVAKGMKSIIGDIRDFESVLTAMKSHQPEIIIHMAAQPLVRLSYLQPIETYATNVMGTVHVLEAARQTSSVRAIVNVTTDKCYENREWVWGYREDEPMGGHDPYSNSKGCSELVTASYRNSFFNNTDSPALASARAGNVIGGGDWANDRLVPDILRAFQENKPVVIRNPYSTRPWQHVLEPLSGYLRLAEKLYTDGAVFAEGWNLGPNEDDARPVQWIVEYMVSKWGAGASWILDESTQPHEASYLKLDISKAKSKLDWSPCWTLSSALDNISAWHLAWIENNKMRNFSLNQIEQFTNTKLMNRDISAL